MTVSINNVINTSDDTIFNTFDLFLQENPQYLTELNDNGQTPLHVAVEAGDLRLIQTLIKRGGRLDQANLRGDSALRMAAKINDSTIIKYLAKNSTDLSSAFKFMPDLKEDTVSFVFMRLGVWGAWSAFLMLFAMVIFPAMLFVPALLMGLWISAIIATVIGLIITLFTTYEYFKDNYMEAPGYIGEQQTRLLKAIELHYSYYDGQYHVDGSVINEILAENINWLFPPITLFRNSAMLRLTKTEEGRRHLISIMPQIAQSDSALNNLLSTEDHKQLLIKHPELFRALVDSLSLASIVQYKETLFDIFYDNIGFFRENSQASTDMFAKLTVCGMGWDGDDSLAFIPQALLSKNTAMAHLSKGYIAKCGWYGTSLNDAEAMTAFKAVGRENPTLYIQAQQELAVLNIVASGSEGRTDAEWITRFFQGLSHYHNVLSSPIDANNQVGLIIKDSAEDFLTNILDRAGAGEFFSDLVNANCLTWTTEEGDTPILLAAKLGYWDLVELIAQRKPELIDIEQYGQLLLAAITANEEAIVGLLVKHPAFREQSLMVLETGNSPCHEAIRTGSVDVLRLLLASDKDLSHENKEGLTPIAFAAKLKCWDMVRQIATSHAINQTETYQYEKALNMAVYAREAETVRCLITQGALQASRYIDPITGNGPCHLAVFNNDEGILKQLLASNQDLSQRNKEGDTPIVLAANLGHWHLVKAIMDAYPTATDDLYQYGKALFLAINAGQTDIAQGLVNRGALRGQVYTDPATGDSSWHAVVKLNNLEMLKCLLAKTDVPLARLYQDKNKNGETVFALSAKMDNPQLNACIVNDYPREEFRFFRQADIRTHGDLQLLSEPRV